MAADFHPPEDAVLVHDQFLQLLPGGAPKLLSPDKIARILRTIPTRSGDPVADQRRQVVVDLLADLRHAPRTGR